MNNKAISWSLLIGMLMTVGLHYYALQGHLVSDSLGLLARCISDSGWQSFWQMAAQQFSEGQGLDNNNYRPVPILSFCLEANLFGLRPGLFHATQLALHLLNGILVYRIALLLLPAETLSRKRLAGFAACFFWFSPAAPEVSIWLAGRFDVLATLFMLLAVEWRLQRYLWRSLAAMFFALLCKESAMILPAVFVLIDLHHHFSTCSQADGLSTRIKK